MILNLFLETDSSEITPGDINWFSKALIKGLLPDFSVSLKIDILTESTPSCEATTDIISE